TETLRSERNVATNVTTLSGEIGDPTKTADNSYHVVYSSGLDKTAILDGFTITGGNADGGSLSNFGGGMYNDNSSPTLTNVTFSGNYASNGGGGMYNYTNCSPTLTDVTFSGNSALYGGGLYNFNSGSPRLTNVTFSRNSASNYGGGLF